jgi:hypothetical protein
MSFLCRPTRSTNWRWEIPWWSVHSTVVTPMWSCHAWRVAYCLRNPHLKDKMPKIWNKHSQKRNIAVSVPISTFMCLWANYIFPRCVFLFCWRKYVDRRWEYINRSQTHECGNWGWGHAIPRKGIHKRNCRCNANSLAHHWKTHLPDATSTIWLLYTRVQYQKGTAWRELCMPRLRLSTGQLAFWLEHLCPDGYEFEFSVWTGSEQ